MILRKRKDFVKEAHLAAAPDKSHDSTALLLNKGFCGLFDKEDGLPLIVETIDEAPLCRKSEGEES
jgi:hypothetical protein